MKKSTLFAMLFLGAIPCLTAQNEPSRYEVGLQFSGINFSDGNQFSGIVKIRKSENVYRRIGFTFGQLNALFNRGNDQFTFSGSISFGKENRKYVRKKTMLYHGINYRLSFTTSVAFENEPFISIRPGLGYILGIQHDFNEYFAMNLEIIPSASVNFNSQSGFYNLSVGAGFSSSPNLGLMYRF